MRAPQAWPKPGSAMPSPAPPRVSKPVPPPKPPAPKPKLFDHLVPTPDEKVMQQFFPTDMEGIRQEVERMHTGVFRDLRKMRKEFDTVDEMRKKQKEAAEEAGWKNHKDSIEDRIAEIMEHVGPLPKVKDYAICKRCKCNRVLKFCPNCGRKKPKRSLFVMLLWFCPAPIIIVVVELCRAYL